MKDKNRTKVDLIRELKSLQRQAKRLKVAKSRRKKIVKAYRENEKHNHTTLYIVGNGVIANDTKGNVQQMHSAAEIITNWSERKVKGKSISQIFYIVNEETRKKIKNPVYRVMYEWQGNRLRSELIQSQKMQSIGTLAVGIAHDFNNILNIILGYTSLLEKQRLDDKKHAEGIATINHVIQRGTALVRQIMTFARRTDFEFEPFDLADLIHELISMLRQTFPRIISFTENVEKDIPYICADRTQIYQALLNLCINARDAMPNGGILTINTNIISGINMRNQYPDATASSYISIEVSDTGEGMTSEIRKHIFEPFFTTKEKGKGTGLGLSLVFDVIQTHKGFVDVESELRKGSTFRLYLPTSQKLNKENR